MTNMAISYISPGEADQNISRVFKAACPCRLLNKKPYRSQRGSEKNVLDSLGPKRLECYPVNYHIILLNLTI